MCCKVSLAVFLIYADGRQVLMDNEILKESKPKEVMDDCICMFRALVSFVFRERC